MGALSTSETLVRVLLALGVGGVVGIGLRLVRPSGDAAWDGVLRDVALAASVAAILLLTVTPSGRGGDPHRVELIPFRDLAWALAGHGSVRGAILELGANVALFVPLGAAFAWRLARLGVARIAAVAFVLSLAVESIQAVAPIDRVASVTDLVANTLGGALGALAVHGVRAGTKRSGGR